MIQWTLLFSILAVGVRASDPILTDEVRLRKDLLSTYVSDRRPVKDKKIPLAITLQMTLQYFTIVEHTDKITVRSSMTVKWQDEYLTWNPEDYSGVKSLRLKDKIWLPKESIYMSSMNSQNWNSEFSHPCDVQFNGSVTCIPFVTHDALCGPVENEWPYEFLVCPLRFGTWEYTEEELKLTFAEEPVSLSEFQENRQWKLKSAISSQLDKYTVYNDTYPAKYITFIMKKRTATNAAVVVVPVITLAILTVASGLMASGGLRIGVAVTTLLAQIFYLYEIVTFLPLNGDYPDHIVKLFLDCSIITTVTILMYVIIVAMTKLTHKPPRFISIIITFAKVVPAKIITFGEFDTIENSTIGDPKDQTDSKDVMANLEWRKFATIVNNMFFYIITIVYIVLISIYV